MNSLGYFDRDGGSSKGPPQARDLLTRCFAMPCADRRSTRSPARAQTLTPDLFRPQRDGFLTAQNSPLRKIGDKTGDPHRRPDRSHQRPKARDKDSYRPRRRGSARSRLTACPPPTARPTPASTRSTARARSQNFIRARQSQNRRRVPARPRRRPRRRLWFPTAASDWRSRHRRPPTSRRSRRRWPAP